MRLSPSRVAIALGCGFVATGAFYLLQQPVGALAVADPAPAARASEPVAVATTSARPAPPMELAVATASVPTHAALASPSLAHPVAAAREHAPIATVSTPVSLAEHPIAPHPPLTSPETRGASRSVPAARGAETAHASPPVTRSSEAAHASVPVSHASGTAVPRRIVVKHAQPGDVVFTMRGEEVEVEFRQTTRERKAP